MPTKWNEVSMTIHRPYIGLVLWLDIKCLVESVDDCYEHCMPSINICWMNICNWSASQSWRKICCYKWCIHFYFDRFLKLTWHCAFYIWTIWLPWCSSSSNLFSTLMADKSSWNTTLMILFVCSVSFNNFQLTAAQSRNSLQWHLRLCTVWTQHTFLVLA